MYLCDCLRLSIKSRNLSFFNVTGKLNSKISDNKILSAEFIVIFLKTIESLFIELKVIGLGFLAFNYSFSLIKALSLL